MADLRTLCIEAGFEGVRTYIASGNVVLSSGQSAGKVKETLEDRLKSYAGKPVEVLLRTESEMRGILDRNPFADREPKSTLVVFLEEPPDPDALDDVAGLNGEEMVLGEREIYVHYPRGMGQSKLRIRAAKAGTGRNLNTVKKLAEMVGEIR